MSISEARLANAKHGFYYEFKNPDGGFDTCLEAALAADDRYRREHPVEMTFNQQDRLLDMLGELPSADMARNIFAYCRDIILSTPSTPAPDTDSLTRGEVQEYLDRNKTYAEDVLSKDYHYMLFQRAWKELNQHFSQEQCSAISCYIRTLIGEAENEQRLAAKRQAAQAVPECDLSAHEAAYQALKHYDRDNRFTIDQRSLIATAVAAALAAQRKETK